MTITHHRTQTAFHEAGHASAFLVQGLLPRLVTADRPSAGSFGITAMDWPNGARGQVEEIAIAVLGGTEWDESWPPTFPPDRDTEGDESQLAAAVRLLKIDESRYRELIERAEELMATPEFIRVRALIARALELKDVLDAEDLRWLVGDLVHPTQEQEYTHVA